MIHDVVHNTSTFEEFSDNTTGFTRQVYACPNLRATEKITATDLNTPTWMRAPGAVSGMFALESAMDELAYALKIDPLELTAHQLCRGRPGKRQAVFKQGA